MNNNGPDIEGKLIEAGAMITKNPFKTAFLASLGLGLSRLVLFCLFLGAVVGFVKVMSL